MINLYRDISCKEKDNASMTTPKTFLHVGCGQNRKDKTTRGFNTPEWTELRLDIDPSVEPNIVGTMLDMSAVSDGSVDALFSSHNIEHLCAHEVPLALAEFLRVLKSSGYLVLTCPDLQSVCQLVAEDKLTEQVYISPTGSIMPVDILYGLRSALEAGNLYMAHKCGFTKSVLQGTLNAAGFTLAAGMARGYAPFFDLWMVASKGPMTEDTIREIAAAHFP